MAGSMQNRNRKEKEKMKVVLCIGDFCIPNKCPAVDVQENQVVIGEKDNICTLTKEQFGILKEKIKNNEI